MTIILLLIILASLPFSAIGLFMTYQVIRTQRSPADNSNRFNKVRLVWFAMTREELFVGTFRWMKNDELENVTYED